MVILEDYEETVKISESIIGLLKMFQLNKKKKYLNKRKTEFQKKILQELFSITQYPTKEIRIDLSYLLNFDLKTINIWFQNERNSLDQILINPTLVKIDNDLIKKINIKLDMKEIKKNPERSKLKSLGKSDFKNINKNFNLYKLIKITHKNFSLNQKNLFKKL